MKILLNTINAFHPNPKNNEMAASDCMSESNIMVIPPTVRNTPNKVTLSVAEGIQKLRKRGEGWGEGCLYLPVASDVSQIIIMNVHLWLPDLKPFGFLV